MTREYEEILLDKPVVPYKEHIRKIVEASTIHERNNFDTYQNAMRIIAKNPTTKLVTPRWVLAIAIAYAAGVMTFVYAYLI